MGKSYWLTHALGFWGGGGGGIPKKVKFSTAL